MENNSIKNHRGLCELTYCDLNHSIKQIKKLGSNLVIIDENVSKINPHLLEKLSFIPNYIVLNPGEKTKTLKGVCDLLSKIEDMNIYPLNHVTIIGGATIQDTCGTALSLLKRGVDWTYIPTTLLAQADSCIGSKTSINSEKTKNLYGLFYSPKKIFIIPEFLKSLPEIEILSGIGDAMHYLMIDIQESFKYILNISKKITENGIKNFIDDHENVLLLSNKVHKIKKYYIENDEFDKSERKVLNLGHSFGHALEALFEYKLPHGIAVLFGLIYAVDLSIYLFEETNNRDYNRWIIEIRKSILSILEIYSPIKTEEVFHSVRQNKEKYLGILTRDKKNINLSSFKLVLFKNNKVSLLDCERSNLADFLES